MNFYERMQESWAERTAPEYNLIKRSKADPNSRAKAINAFCFSCVGGDGNNLPDPGWKHEITNCTSPDCPLYRFRPYQIKTVKE